jgi:hypothetical protein
MDTFDKPPSPPDESVFKKPILVSTIIALFVAGYLAFTLFTRWESNRAIERRSAEKLANERRANDIAAVRGLGGSELAIRALYVTPAVVHEGEEAQLCYDVANAKTVTLDPPAGEVWPSHTRCLNISPKKTTTYTLTIKDVAGQTATQSVKLEVRDRPPLHIKSFPSQ